MRKMLLLLCLCTLFTCTYAQEFKIKRESLFTHYDECNSSFECAGKIEATFEEGKDIVYQEIRAAFPDTVKNMLSKVIRDTDFEKMLEMGRDNPQEYFLLCLYSVYFDRDGKAVSVSFTMTDAAAKYLTPEILKELYRSLKGIKLDVNRLPITNRDEFQYISVIANLFQPLFDKYQAPKNYKINSEK